MIDPLPDAVLARRTSLPVKPAAVTLRGSVVELRPIDLDADCAPLHEVSNGQPCALGDRRVDAYDADELIWRWMRGRAHRDAGELRAYLEADARAADLLMMTVCELASGAPIGVACFMANRPSDLKIELGNIWYGPIAQGTGAAREATHLMCAHAFGLGYRRVEWKCDARNERSRRAALSYGFTFEGIQDCHMIVKGRSRDTAWFRMLNHEWPR
ncbi:MAG: GNAT family N-acetyltransferase [Deltaproteobacteria bacterium]|nr:GNAT family N-acetyltransferase [Deltaproteobacteria bacterium]